MPNDTCAAAIVISASPYTVHMDTSANADDPSVSPPCGFSGGAKAAWWKFTNSSSAPVAVVAETDPSASHYHDISVWSGACGSLTNVACENITYSGKGIRVQAIVPAGESRYILVTDDDFGTGVVFDLTVTGTSLGTSGYLVASSAWTLDAYNLAIISKATGDLVGGAKPVDSRIDGLTQRPSGNILGFNIDRTVWEFSPTLALLSTTTLTPPTFTGASFEWNIFSLLFNPAGELYILWSHGSGSGDHWALQKLDPSTFAVLTEWDDFTSDGPTAFGIDNTSFYFSSESAGTTSQTIYKINLTTGVVTTFGAYGSRTAGINPVGDFVGEHNSIHPLSSGKVFATYSHSTDTPSPEADGITLVVFSALGAVESAVRVDSSLGNAPEGTVIAADELSIYILDVNRNAVGPTLSQYLLDGTELLVGPYIGGDVLLASTGMVGIAGSVVPPTPPTLPPSVLVNSTPCCDTAGSTAPSAGPVLPPVNTDWIPSCTGGGLVPTTASLVLTELWDY